MTQLFYKSFILSLLLVIGYKGVHSECPYGDGVKPCTCAGDEIFTCAGDKPINLKEIFGKFSKTLKDDQKELEHIIIKNSAIEEIPDNVFGDIYFRTITFTGCTNLKKISPNAFSGTDTFTENFNIDNSPKLGATPNVLFDVLNKFKKLAVINIGHVGLKEIPSPVFKSMDKLFWLAINGTEITKINEKAFYNLNTLTELHITETSIPHIGSNVFVFSEKSDIPLELVLYKNPKLSGAGAFDAQTFMNMGRPGVLDFSGDHLEGDVSFKQMKVLDEKIFLPFLKLNELNKIGMRGQPFDCDDCQNAWIKKMLKLDQQFEGLKCANGKDPKDAANFAKCK